MTTSGRGVTERSAARPGRTPPARRRAPCGRPRPEAYVRPRSRERGSDAAARRRPGPTSPCPRPAPRWPSCSRCSPACSGAPPTSSAALSPDVARRPWSSGPPSSSGCRDHAGGPARPAPSATTDRRTCRGRSPPAWPGWSGLVCFYAALASGTMGVVSPIAALGVVVPVLVGLAQGRAARRRPAGRHRRGHRRCRAGQRAGALRAGRGAPGAAGGRRGRRLRAGAALHREGQSESSTLMTLVTMRATSVTVVAVALVVALQRVARSRLVPGPARPGAGRRGGHR